MWLRMSQDMSHINVSYECVWLSMVLAQRLGRLAWDLELLSSSPVVH